MNLSELIRSRRSIKQFRPDPVNPELVGDLLEVALYAPNHRFTQPWRFILLAGEARDGYAELRAKDAENRGKDATKTRQAILAIPAILIAVVRRSPDNPTLGQEDFAATCCAVQNFLLLAWERGLGTSWKTFPDIPELRQFLGLQPADEEEIVAAIYLGYPAEIPVMRERKSARELLRVL